MNFQACYVGRRVVNIHVWLHSILYILIVLAGLFNAHYLTAYPQLAYPERIAW
jgi:hypothetical protein